MGKKDNNFFIGTLIGGLVGAATALFLAPKSGRDLRNDLNTQASVVKGKTERWREEAAQRGSELASVAKEKSTNFSQTVSEQSSQIMTKVKDLGNVKTQQHDQGKSESHPKNDDSLQDVIDEVISTDSLDSINQTEEIQKKLEEAHKAFEEAENRNN